MSRRSARTVVCCMGLQDRLFCFSRELVPGAPLKYVVKTPEVFSGVAPVNVRLFFGEFRNFGLLNLVGGVLPPVDGLFLIASRVCREPSIRQGRFPTA